MKNYCVMSTLLSEIKEDYDADHASFVADFFENLGLPVPQYAREYSNTSDDGYMVFLNDAACIIRIISSREAPAIDHPFILQPLFRRTYGILRAEVFPGVRTPASEMDTRYVAARLYEDEIELGDAQLANVGYVPYASKAYPKGFPVVIDQGAFDYKVKNLYSVLDPSPIDFAAEQYRKGFNERREALQALFNKRAGESVNAQDVVFGDLREAFLKAWPHDSDCANPEKMAQVWKGCCLMKAQGTLVANWMQEYKRETNFKNIFHGAANYQERCQKEGREGKEKGFTNPAKPSSVKRLP